MGYGLLEKAIRKSIKDRKLEKYIKLVIKPDNLEQLYKDSDVYVCTSLTEGLSNTILEAMGASLPVIATNVGDNSRLVVPEKNGFLFDCNDYKKQAEHILTLLNSKNKRIAFGLSSYNLLKNNYTLKIFRQKYFQFIDNL